MKNIAPPGLRILAGVIEMVLGILVLLYFVLVIVSGTTVAEILNAGLQAILFSLIVLPIVLPVINLLLVSRAGGSVGKLLSGIAVVNRQGTNITFKTAFLREILGKMVSGAFLSLGNIWILVDQERRGWHDMIADTYVVKKSEAGLITGLVSLVVLLGATWYVGQQAFANVRRNIPLYQEIIGDIKEEMKPKVQGEPVEQSVKLKYQNVTPTPRARTTIPAYY